MTTMAITADQVKKLRDATGAGMMECKAALTEASGDLDAAIAALARGRVDCMYIQPAPPVPAFVREIGALLLKHRIPAISELRDLARSGAVLSYGPNLFESTRRQVYFVDRILKGTKPADLPVEQATKLELVIDLKTAKALGLDVPPTLLARADGVIE